MPELPEVEHLRRTLARVLPGRRVVDVSLHRADVCERPGGGVPTPDELLLGAVFRAPVRHGKQLALATADGRALRVHLGMTGQLVVRARGRGPGRTDHVHATWTLDNGSHLLFRDPRRFGGLAAYATLRNLRRAEWSRLGPDAASISSAELTEGLGTTTRAIKAALLDQEVLAGVGNIYADESLFRASIHPLRRANRLSPGAVDSLAAAIRDTLALAIAGGGSTLRDYVDGNGEPGRHQFSHLVYGRAGNACVRCRRRLRSCRIAQRTTVFCVACQARRATPVSRVFPQGPSKKPAPSLRESCVGTGL